MNILPPIPFLLTGPGVPQGSVLGPILLNILSSGLMTIIFEEFSISAYCYADDTQFYVTFDPKSGESEDKARNLIYKTIH